MAAANGHLQLECSRSAKAARVAASRDVCTRGGFKAQAEDRDIDRKAFRRTKYSARFARPHPPKNNRQA
eukprot:6301479-Pyramimonas_sp.AAC.1